MALVDTFPADEIRRATATEDPHVDNVIATQQERIRELEEKLKVAREEVTRLRDKVARKNAEKGGNTSKKLGVQSSPVTEPSSPVPRRSLKAKTPHGKPFTLGATAATTSAAIHVPVPVTARKDLKKSGSTQPVETPKVAKQQPPAKPMNSKKRKAKDMSADGMSRYWTVEEHNLFLKGISIYGPRGYNQIASFVGSRTSQQVRTHAQKYEMKLAREAARSDTLVCISKRDFLGLPDLVAALGSAEERDPLTIAADCGLAPHHDPFSKNLAQHDTGVLTEADDINVDVENDTHALSIFPDFANSECSLDDDGASRLKKGATPEQIQEFTTWLTLDSCN